VLAATAVRDHSEVEGALARWPNVDRDAQGRVVAFSGLSLAHTAHRFKIAGRELYAWCAWDTLFLPGLLGLPADVQSHCPVTGAEVRLTVTPEGVRAAEPPTLWLSFPQPPSASAADITGTFCCHVHFLASHEAASGWSRDHAGAVVLTLEAAYELGGLATRTLRACREATNTGNGRRAHASKDAGDE
jgi:alkylmercury lyase